MRVIICGLTDNIDSITSRINSLHEIVGYTDIKKYLKRYNCFNGIKYDYISNFKEYDALVISYSSNIDIDLAFTEFSSIKSKVVVYQWFKNATICDPVSGYLNSDLSFSQIILGMSHSQNDIQTHLMDKNTFKFSFPSMDLFCHNQIIKKISNSNKTTGIETAIIELPYYIFNYDLSKSKRSIKNRLFYFKQFGDYHHYGANDSESHVIQQFDTYLNLFYHCAPLCALNNSELKKENSYLSWLIKGIYHQISVFRENARIWESEYQETREENENILKQLVECLYQINSKMKIYVVVCPFNPLFRLLHMRKIKKEKKYFYDVVEKMQVKIIDDFKWTNNPFLFLDHCHLTTKGSYKYTNYLNNKLVNIDYSKGR